jgi:hypothetical protein
MRLYGIFTDMAAAHVAGQAAAAALGADEDGGDETEKEGTGSGSGSGSEDEGGGSSSAGGGGGADSKIDEVVRSLPADYLEKLLGYIKDWNTNTK